MNAAAFQRLGSKRGSGGNALFGIPPGGFPPLSTRESGLVPQASLRDCKQSLSLVALQATYASPRESGPVLQASLGDCKQSLSLVTRKRDLLFAARKRPFCPAPVPEQKKNIFRP